MYRKNVAGQYLYFALINASTGAALTGATVTGKRAIDGAAQASVTGTITEEAGGQYKIALSQADINGNNIGFLFTATSAIPVNISVVTTAADPTDSVRFGLTALPNAAASAVGGLPLSVDTSGRVDALKINGTSQTARDIGASVLLSTGTGTGQLDFTSGVVKSNVTQLLGTAWLTPAVAGTPDVNAKQLGGTAQTGRDVGASVLLSAGSGTGQLDFTSGVVKSNLSQILATALTETSGQIAGGFKKFFNVALPVFTAAAVNQTGDAYARLGAPSGGVAIANDIAAVKVDTAAIKTQTDNFAFTVPNQVDCNVLDWKSSAAPAMTGDAYARLGAPAGASHAADVAAVKSDTGGLRTDYTTARAGYLDTLNGLVAAIWASATRTLTAFGFTVTATADPNVALIKAKTDNLPASPAAVSDIPTATANADALLKRDMSAVSGEAARSPLNALRFLRNKWSLSGATLTVTKEDDTTSAWTSAVTTDAAADPVTGSDPT